ncbi:MAG: phosphatase PAP2 family protein [Desulfovibrionaceae bacterium]|jgi:undecaprenyl-diphosphatase|nr:phosphatase PAP2 family protein [Desulfovibrionaceae bacterium]
MRSRPVVHALLTVLPLTIALALLWQQFGAGWSGRAAVQAFCAAHRAAHPAVALAARLATDWGNAVFYVVYAVLLARGLRSGDRAAVRLALTYAVVQILVGFLLVRALKISIGAPRPGVDGFNTPGSFSSAHNSMPSGHTAEITGATLPLALRARSLAVPALLGLTVLLVGASRVYLGWHHPEDVFCGLLVGAWAGLLIHFAARPGFFRRPRAAHSNNQ